MPQGTAMSHVIRCASPVSSHLMTHHPGVWAQWFHSGHFIESCCISARRSVLQERYRRSQHSVWSEICAAVAVYHPPPVHAALLEQFTLESFVALCCQRYPTSAQGKVIQTVAADVAVFDGAGVCSYNHGNEEYLQQRQQSQQL
jgi:hypothetical protein